jgi:chemotaxis protein histidine kinase CheA
MIKEPTWKYRETITKSIEVKEKDDSEREVAAVDLDLMPFVLNVASEISMENIKIGEIYKATIKVYTAEMTPEIDKLWSELEKENPDLQEGIKKIRKFGGQEPLHKFELTKIKPI